MSPTQAFVIVVRLVMAFSWWVLWSHQSAPAADTAPQSKSMVHIPAGEFQMGSPVGNDSFPDEAPQRFVYLSAFLIDRYEVTNDDYARFVQATGHRIPENAKPASTLWEEGKPLPGIEDHPVVNVSWDDATAYCHWQDKRLPTEAEWEKAARGPDGRRYPWSDAWDPTRANCALTVGGTTPVGTYPTGASPYGAQDMAGNVQEWVQDWFGADYYAYGPTRDPRGPSTGVFRMVRGGTWSYEPFFLSTTWRSYRTGDNRHAHIGFRCATSQVPSLS
jgi:formylglycine-generating enzyme required for sulfatase activity